MATRFYYLQKDYIAQLNAMDDAVNTTTSLSVAQTFTKAQRGAFYELTDTPSIALDMSQANQFKLQISGNRFLAVPTNIVEGQQGAIIIRQDINGGRILSFAWCYEWFANAENTLSILGCARDLLAYSVDEYNTGEITLSIGANALGTFPAHSFYSGQKIQLTTTGSLPAGLSVNTTYYILVLSANTFKFCTSRANVTSNIAITTSGSQSGVHTVVGCSITLALNKDVS